MVEMGDKILNRQSDFTIDHAAICKKITLLYLLINKIDIRQHASSLDLDTISANCQEILFLIGKSPGRTTNHA